MKLVASFFIGMVFCMLLIFGLGCYASAVMAEDDPGSPGDSLGIAELLPDIGMIFRESLGSPYRQVKSEITDPYIASYYQNLMDRTGLDKIGAE